MANALSRRAFLQAGTLVTAASYIENGIKTHLLAEAPAEPARPYAANDQIQVALIGAGGMGQGDTRTAAQVPGRDEGEYKCMSTTRRCEPRSIA